MIRNRKPEDIRIDICLLSQDTQFYMQIFSCNIYNKILVAGTLYMYCQRVHISWRLT